jgi:hypothetical protein
MIHSKGDPYVGSLIQLSKEVNPPFSHEVFGGILLNQNYPTLESIPYKKTIGARFETYYPFDIHPPKSTIQNLYYYNDVSCLNNNNVMCLHWYNGHGMSKEYINNNGFERDCSMTTILKEGGYI